MEARLVVVGGDSQTRQFELHLPAVIGRSRSTDVTLGNPLISRQHCEVFEANGMLMVRDLGSLNGTYVGEMRIAEQAMPVKPGDLLTIGPVTLKAVYRQAGQLQAKESTWNKSGQTLDAPPSEIIADAEEATERPPGFGANPNDTPPKS